MNWIEEVFQLWGPHWERSPHASVGAMFYEAEKLARAKHAKRATELVEAAIARDPANHQTWLSAAAIWALLGDVVKERAAWVKVIELRGYLRLTDEMLDRIDEVQNQYILQGHPLPPV